MIGNRRRYDLDWYWQTVPKEDDPDGMAEALGDAALACYALGDINRAERYMRDCRQESAKVADEYRGFIEDQKQERARRAP